MTTSLLERRETPAVTQPRSAIFAPVCAAIQFLTIVPPIIRRTFTPAELGWSVTFFPLAGAVIGGILIGVDRGAALLFPPNVTAVLVLVSWVLATGGLHLDGFLDTCDGLLGGHTPEDRLRIMHDERVGAYAVMGGILLVLVKFNALAALDDRETALMLAPMLGRWAMVIALIGFPYGRPDGLGRDLKDNSGWRQGLLASLLAVPVAIWLGVWSGLAAVVLVLATVLAGAWFVLRRLPGLTGDVYGCMCELCETLVLLTFVAGGRA
jgi:adenosylcobinamide-GDP ribazoletransferase